MGLNTLKQANAPVAEEVKEVKEEVKEVKEEVNEEATAGGLVIDPETLGSKQKAIQFVGPLGDPANIDTTDITNDDGTKGKATYPTIVGYRFKAMEDIRVPDCGTNLDLNHDPMSYEASCVDNTVEVKAGETFDLTLFETALLLSQPEFNTMCYSVDGKEVKCAYVFKGVKNKAGVAISVSSATETPRVSLRVRGGSIKDYVFTDVLTYDLVNVNGRNFKKRNIIKGFEKWASIAVNSSLGGKKKAPKTEVMNKNAQTFLKIVNAKKLKK